MTRKGRRPSARPLIDRLESRTLLDAGARGLWPLSNPDATDSVTVTFRAVTPAAVAPATLNALGGYVAQTDSSGSQVVVLGQGVSPAAARSRLLADPHVLSAVVGDVPGGAAPSGAGLDAGINLAPNSSAQTDAPWVDVKNMLGPWISTGGSHPALSPDGYPYAPSATSTNLKNYTDGTYLLSYTGTGTVTVSGMGHITGVDATYSAEVGYTVYDVAVSHKKAGQLTLGVTGVSAGNTIDNLSLVSPGYDPINHPVFTPQFIQDLQPFSTIRFGTWEQVNNNPQVNWSDRTPAAGLQTGASGVSWEYLIAMANQANKDVWINIPDQATADYVTQMADLVRNNLHPGANVYLEYSSEVWNPRFQQQHRVQAAGEANPVVATWAVPVFDPTNPTDHSHDYIALTGAEVAYQLNQDAAIFRNEFAATGQSGEVQPILGGRAVSSYFAEAELQFLSDNYGPPSQIVTGFAINPYDQMLPPDDAAGLTLDGLFASMDNYLVNRLAPNVAANAALATQYGVQMLAYEGGPSNPALNPKTHQNINYNVKLAAQSDPRMAQVLRDLFDVWKQNGGGLFSYYVAIQSPAPPGEWGLLDNISEPGTVKWDAMLGELLPAGDANAPGGTNGQATYADFLALKNNFLSGTWRSQGDFDQDRMVDWSDFESLLQNLDPSTLTPTQAADVAAFAGQPHWAFDFGTASSPVSAGYTQVTDTTVYGQSGSTYGWTAGSVVTSADRGTGSVVNGDGSTTFVNTTSDLNRDFNTTTSGEFDAAVNNGIHRVLIRLGDPAFMTNPTGVSATTFQDTSHTLDQMSVTVNGKALAPVSTTPGSFANLVTTVNVTDGVLRVQLQGLDPNNPNVNVEDIEVF